MEGRMGRDGPLKNYSEGLNRDMEAQLSSIVNEV